MKQSRSAWIGLAGLVWVAAIVVTYFVTHKPITPEIAAGLGLAAWRVVAAGLMVFTAGGLGAKFFPLPELHPLARLSLQAAIGLGGMALGLLIIGSLALPVWLPWLLLAALFLWLFRAGLLWVKQMAGLKEIWSESSSFERWVCGLLGATLLASALIALAPPLRYDALMYHLVMPQAYLQDGRIGYLPWIAMTGMPQVSEMLYTWAMALGGAQTSALLGWMAAVLALLGLMGYLRMRLSVRAAWVGAASLLAGYTLAIACAWAYVDWFSLYFGLGCLIALDGWRIHAKNIWLVAAGITAGLAFGTKYTAGVLAIAAGITLLYHIWKGKGKAIPAVGLFAGMALLVMLPWLIRNTIYTGNPFYPFFFAAGDMDAVRIGVYQGLPTWGNWQDILLLPWRATYLGVENAGGYSVSVGPLLLGLGALAWVGRRNLQVEGRVGLQTSAVLAVSGLVVWVIGNQVSGYLIQTRMYFSLFPAFAALAAYGFEGISGLQIPQVRLGRIVQALILLVLALNGLQVWADTIQKNPLPVILGSATEEDYLAQNLGWFQPAMQAINDLPEGSQVLLLYETRSFYCAPVCYPDEILDRWKAALAREGSPEAVLAAWRAEGFTHVMYYQAGADFLRTANDPHHPVAEIDSLEGLLDTLPEPVHFGGLYELYTLTP
jgi:hypothetical protein